MEKAKPYLQLEKRSSWRHDNSFDRRKDPKIDENYNIQNGFSFAKPQQKGNELSQIIVCKPYNNNILSAPKLIPSKVEGENVKSKSKLIINRSKYNKLKEPYEDNNMQNDLQKRKSGELHNPFHRHKGHGIDTVNLKDNPCTRAISISSIVISNSDGSPNDENNVDKNQERMEKISSEFPINASDGKNTSFRENFIRRNLRNKGSYKQSSIRSSNLKRRRMKCSSSDDRNRKENLNSDDDADLRVASVFGMTQLGLDPLQLSINLSAELDKSHTGIILQIPDEILDRPQNRSYDHGKRQLKRQLKNNDFDKYGLNEESYRKFAPLCTGHNHVAALLTVKKSGNNKGRKFYGCTFPAEERCDFFMWAEDNPDLLPLILKSSSTATNPGLVSNISKDRSHSSTVTNAISKNSATSEVSNQQNVSTWQTNALRSYRKKLDSLTVSELQQEVSRAKRARLLRLENGVEMSEKSIVKSALKITGRRDDLIHSLVMEAEQRLGCGQRDLTDDYKAIRKRKKSSPLDDSNGYNEGVTTAKRRKEAALLDHESVGGDSKGSESDIEVDSVLSNSSEDTMDELNVSSEEDETRKEMDCESAFRDIEGTNSPNENINSCTQLQMEFTDKDLAVPHVTIMIENIPCNDMISEPENKNEETNNKLGIISLSQYGSISVSRVHDDDDDDDSDKMREGSEEWLELSDEEESDEADKEGGDLRKPVEQSTTTVNIDTYADHNNQRSLCSTVTSSRNALNVEENSTSSTSISDSQINLVLRSVFGFEDFRTGQRWAVERVLSGRNSLLVLPTGAGKSLCFLAPTVVLPGLTIVVSPLIALMQEQLKKLPPELPGACFGSGMTAMETATLTSQLLQGYIKVLFVSPERLCTSSFRHLIRRLPGPSNSSDSTTSSGSPVSLLCLDEAHCLSQWSFNFRPAYLRIRRELKHLKPRSILALTATAPPHVQRDIMLHLNIDPERGLWAAPPYRDNLILHAFPVNNDDEKRKIIVKELGGKSGQYTSVAGGRGSNQGGYDEDSPWLAAAKITDRLKSGDLSQHRKKQKEKKGPTIVYVWRRQEAEALVDFLKAHGISAVAYHGGLERKEREKAQQLFDRGKIDAMVATTAFGMGLDKGDIRQVIHQTAPKSVENYVQEIGRAGRDGGLSYCTLLLTEEDLITQYALAQSSRISCAQIYGLLSKVFVLCDESHGLSKRWSLLTSVVIDLETVVSSLDISETTIETLLAILELPPFSMIEVQGTHLDSIRGNFRRTVTGRLQDDKLIQALMKRKVIKKATEDDDDDLIDALKTAAGNGMSADLYGSGYSSIPLTSHTIGYETVEFDGSVHDIASNLCSTRGIILSNLYEMQKQGLLAYNLSRKAVEIELNEEAKANLNFDSIEAYEEWLWVKASILFDFVNRHVELEGQRVLDMWRIGKIIENHSCSEMNSEDRLADAAPLLGSVQHCGLSKFLCYYLQNLAGRSTNDQGCLESHDTPSQTLKSLKEEFFSVSLPIQKWHDTDSSSPIHGSVTSLPMKESEKRKLHNDIETLLADSRLQQLVCEINESVGVDKNPTADNSRSNRKENQQNKSKYIDGVFALYVVRILLGLQTGKLTQSAWKGNSLWSSWRSVSFEQLYDLVLKLIKELKIKYLSLYFQVLIPSALQDDSIHDKL